MSASRARAPALARAVGSIAAMLTLLLGTCGELTAVPALAAAAQPAGAADPERGRELLARYHCGICHTIPGVAAARGVAAASLVAFGRRSYIAGRVPNDQLQLSRWIVDPAAVVPGTLMPDMGASHNDARDMAAYLAQLR